MNCKSLVSKIAGTLLALAISGGMLAATASPASAWSYAPIGGSRGNVSLPTVYVGDLASSNGYTQYALYSENGPIAYRSPAAGGAQTVRAVYAVEQYDGSQWRIITSSTVVRQIGATQSGVQLPALYTQPNSARGYFRISWGFGWYNSQGSQIGFSMVLSNQTSDHACVTRVRLCQSQPGYFHTGGYLTGAW